MIIQYYMVSYRNFELIGCYDNYERLRYCLPAGVIAIVATMIVFIVINFPI